MRSCSPILFCVFSRNLPPALLSEWPGSVTCYCTTRGWNGYWNSTKSWFCRRHFSRCSCRNSNPRPFGHESGTLATELFPLPKVLKIKFLKSAEWTYALVFRNMLIFCCCLSLLPDYTCVRACVRACVCVCVCVCVCIVIVKYFPCIWAVFSSVFHWVVDVLLLNVLNVFR